MSRRRSDAWLLGLVVLSITAWTYRQWLLYVIACIVTLYVFPWSVKIIKRIRTTKLSRNLGDIDAMDGLVFEQFVANMLRKQGFSNVRPTEQYDLGVDIVAEKDGIRWGVQVKRYSGLVKAEAVRQVVTGFNIYGCDRAMVITNSTFSGVAQKLAQSNDCVLIDRKRLAVLKNR